MISYLSEKAESPDIYKTDFEDGFVLWRVLPWINFKGFRESRLRVGSGIDLQIEEAVYEKAVFFSSFDRIPPAGLSKEELLEFKKMDRDNQDAGIISTVVKAILSTSGVTKGEQIFAQLDMARSLIGNIEDQICVLICRAFPSYTPEDVEKMSWPTILKRAAQAEMILLGYSVELPIKPDTKGADAESRQKDKLRGIIDRVHKSSSGSYDPELESGAEDVESAKRERREQIAKARAEILRQRGH
tara:strand:- start:494 stop:1225 length:732 start_codon:yes stop_codon:yes gene_type:complete